MGKRLYVGNLPYSTTEEGLKGLFAQHGTVENVAIVMDKFSGRSRGFGFVEMTNDDEAKTAIEKLNGHNIDGRDLVVNEARPMEERGERRGGGGGGRGGRFGGGNRDRGRRDNF